MINDRGHIFGASYTSYIPNSITGIPPFDGFLYKNGRMVDIPNGFGGTQVNPFWANNRDQLVGNASFPDEMTFHPFFWDKGVFTDIGTFGGNLGEADWVNDAGDVVGQATLPGHQDQIVHGFLWKKGVLTDLGTVDGDACSGGLSINSGGQIVGVSFACDGSVVHAFLWEDGEIFDLNTLVAPGAGLQLQAANDINNRGEITGNGSLSNGDTHAFLLIPCDDKHGDSEGCADNGERTLAAPQTSAAARDASNRNVPPPLMRRGYRYHMFRRGTSATNRLAD
jgi:probable HAF family extracellular repeat protein